MSSHVAGALHGQSTCEDATARALVLRIRKTPKLDGATAGAQEHADEAGVGDKRLKDVQRLPARKTKKQKTTLKTRAS